MTQTGGDVPDVLITGDKQGGCRVTKPVEGNPGEGRFLRMFPVVPIDQILQRLIGRAVGHLLPVCLGEAPALSLPVGSDYFRL